MGQNGKELMRRICLLFLFFVLVCPATASAGRMADREVLPNGMVLLHAERSALPIIRVVLAIKAGSITEPAEKAGLANLTADLLNEGTARRSSKEISDAIEFVGGELSTSGGSDYITVTLSVLKKDVDLGFDLLSDIVLNPVFSDEEIKRRKTVIKSFIIQQKEEPGIVASKAFKQAVFGDHPYGRPVEGTEESLDAITRRNIIDFHREYYVPNNAILSVVGDITKSELRSLLDRYFKGWAKKSIVEKPLPALEPVVTPTVIKIDKDLTQANIILGHLGIKRENPDYYAVSVMNYILGGGGFASRMMDNIRDNKGLSYDVHSFFSANKYGGNFQAGLQTKNRTANIAVDEILKEMERIRTEPVTDKELSDAKAYLTGSFPLRIDSNSKIASFLIAVEFYSLGLDYVDRYKNLIESVTKDGVLRVAKKYLNTKDYVLVLVGNMKQVTPGD
jgi:zinc protease